MNSSLLDNRSFYKKRGFWEAIVILCLIIASCFLKWLNLDSISLNLFKSLKSVSGISATFNVFTVFVYIFAVVSVLAALARIIFYLFDSRRVFRIIAGSVCGCSMIVISILYIVLCDKLSKVDISKVDLSTVDLSKVDSFESSIPTIIPYLLILVGIAVITLAVIDGEKVSISKRDSIAKTGAWGIRLLAVVGSLLVSAVVIFAIVKMNPLEVYASMWRGAFDETSLFKQIFTFSLTPKTWYFIRDVMILACIAIGLAPAFKMKFWNIGAEGQVLVGCIASAFFMITHAGILSLPLLFVCMIVFSILAGALWGIIPGFFKAKWNANETLFTLMMNYIAIRLTAFCVSKWENPPGSNSVGSIRYQGKERIGWIGDLFKNDKPVKFGNDYMWLVLIVLAVAIFMFIYLRKTKHGYEVAVVGDSENTARYAGIRVPNLYVRTMALSGAVCGLTGFLIVSAVDHTISTGSADGRGFTAIIVAWLAKMNPFVMFLISALLIFLDKGASQIATDFQISEYASEIVSGIVLFFILGSEFFINYKVKIGRNKKEG